MEAIRIKQTANMFFTTAGYNLYSDHISLLLPIAIMYKKEMQKKRNPTKD